MAVARHLTNPVYDCIHMLNRNIFALCVYTVYHIFLPIIICFVTYLYYVYYRFQWNLLYYRLIFLTMASMFRHYPRSLPPLLPRINSLYFSGCLKSVHTGNVADNWCQLTGMTCIRFCFVWSTHGLFLTEEIRTNK